MSRVAVIQHPFGTTTQSESTARQAALITLRKLWPRCPSNGLRISGESHMRGFRRMVTSEGTRAVSPECAFIRKDDYANGTIDQELNLVKIATGRFKCLV